MEDTCGIAMGTDKVHFNLQDNEGEKRELAAGTRNSETPINENARQLLTEKIGKKCSKPVYLSFLPEKYEPLIEDDEEAERRKKEKKNKRKERNKKYRKVGLLGWTKSNWQSKLCTVCGHGETIYAILC